MLHLKNALSKQQQNELIEPSQKLHEKSKSTSPAPDIKAFLSSININQEKEVCIINSSLISAVENFSEKNNFISSIVTSSIEKNEEILLEEENPNFHNQNEDYLPYSSCKPKGFNYSNSWDKRDSREDYGFTEKLNFDYSNFKNKHKNIGNIEGNKLL